MKKLASFLQPSRHFFVLAAAWVLLQAVFFLQFGIVTGFEAQKYIEQAKLLLATGHFESGNFLFYATEILLIALALKANTGFLPVVLVQLAANAFSVVLFYRLAKHLTGQSIVPLYATLAFLGMYYYHLYNVHLFTESLFFSLSVIFAYALLRVQTISIGSLAPVLLSLFLLIFTRPTGVLLIPPAIFYLIFRFGKKKAWWLFALSVLAGLIGFYVLLNAILGSGGELNFLLPYVQEHVICGVPTVQQPHPISVPANQNSVEGLWYIVKNNSDLFTRLARKRFVAFWGVQRPYYAPVHNSFVAVYFYAVYALILLGIRRLWRHHRPFAVFALTYFLLLTLTVVLSCDEWHNRFFYSLLPFLLLMATGPAAKKPAIS